MASIINKARIKKRSLVIRAVAIALIWRGGGGCIFIYSGSARLVSFANEVDFKRSQSGRTQIYEYTPPPPPPISVLATALLVITVLDLKNAFGEVHHNLIQSSVLKYHHVPDHIEDIVGSLYTNFKTSVITSVYYCWTWRTARRLSQPFIF